jgi:hypothetical protein
MKVTDSPPGKAKGKRQKYKGKSTKAKDIM